MSKPLILLETVAMAAILSAQGAIAASPRVEDLIGRMTLEEKVGQLVQRLSGPLEGKAAADSSGLTPTERQLVEIRRGEIGSLQGCCGVKNFNAFQQAAMESRLRIPLMVGHDMVHGVGTQLPIPLGLSATWDTNIWRRTGTLIARETPLRGCNWTYAPMVDIARDARWGRIAESPGQDPYLAALYAAEMVRGIQSEPPAGGMRVAACLKHFVGYGASVGGRDYDEVEMSDRTLDEVYLPPFASGIAAGALTVMPAFHTFNGVPCTVNRFLLTDVLRGRLGFTGFCISDHGALHECGPEGHDVWTTFEEGAAAGLSAGLDQEMTRRGAFTYPRGLANAVRAGLVTEAQLDACVRNVLCVKEALGLFERPFIDVAACEAAVDVERHLTLAREAAAKSAVLLKNAGVLPLRPGARLVVMGDLAANEDEMRGCWSPFFINRRNATLVDGLKADGFAVEYARCYTMTGAVDVAAIEAAAQKGDVVVAAFGEYYWQNGENHSYSDISLRGRQAEAAAAIRRTGKPFVAVVFSGRPLVLSELAQAADAIVEAWNPGSCGGWGVADVLAGAAEPYGRLTADFPRASGQCPLYYNRKPTGRPNDGGRHFWRTHYEDVAFDPLYPFGFGLSYTTFAFANPSVTKEGERVVFSADVTNTGKRRGSEVVQLYLRPRGSSLSAPVRELKGYVRLDLAPGETRRAEIAVPHALLKGKRCDYALAPDSRADGVGGTLEPETPARGCAGEATPVTDEDVRQALESRPVADDKAVRNRLGEVLAGTWVTDGKVPGRVVFEDTFASGSWQGQWEDGYSERGSIVVVDDRRGGKCVKLPPRPRDFNCLRLRRESWIKVDPSRQLAVLWEVRQEEGGHPAFIQFDFYDADGKKVRGDYQLRSNVDPTQPPLFQRNAHLVSARMPSSAALMSITFHHCPKEVDEQASEVASVRVVDLAAAIDGVLAREKPVREGRMRAGADDILVYCDDNLTASYPVMPTGAAVPGSAGRALRIRECPGERTRATVVLWSKSGHRDIEVRISDLKDKQGHVMPSSALSAKVVKAHYQAEGAPGGFLALSDRQVLVPELLLNDDRLVVPDHAHKRNLVKYRWQGREWYVDINSVRRTRFNERITVPTMPIYDARELQPFDLTAGQNKQLAIRIAVPSSALPGSYGGKIDFVEGGKSVACLAVELDVLPFTLPERAETIYDPAQEFTMGLYVWPTIGRTGEDLLAARERSRTQVLDEYRILVDNGVTHPAFIWNNDIVFDDANFRRHLSVVREAGFPGKTLHLAASGHIGNDTDPAKLRQMQERLVRAKSVAREFGFDDVYFYGFDEARGERLLSQIPAWKAAHEVGAKVMVSGYAAHFKMVGEWLDLLVFADNAAGADPSAWHARGHKIWKYDSPQSGPEDPGIFRRNYGMDIWKRGYDGACTYSDIGDGTFWNDVAGYRRMRANGGKGNAYRSLCMLYPTADGVVETLALTGLESAIKDIRILSKFRQLLRKRPHVGAQRWFDAIDPSVADLVKVRREALDWILRLSGESAGR